MFAYGTFEVIHEDTRIRLHLKSLFYYTHTFVRKIWLALFLKLTSLHKYIISNFITLISIFTYFII